MESDQVHVLAGAVSRGVEQGLDALESRLTREIVADIGKIDRRNGVHHDVTVVHSITAAHLDVRRGPDADAASNTPAPDSLSKVFRELHAELCTLEEFSRGQVLKSQPIRVARVLRSVPNVDARSRIELMTAHQNHS